MKAKHAVLVPGGTKEHVFLEGSSNAKSELVFWAEQKKATGDQTDSKKLFFLNKWYNLNIYGNIWLKLEKHRAFSCCKKQNISGYFYNFQLLLKVGVCCYKYAWFLPSCPSIFQEMWLLLIYKIQGSADYLFAWRRPFGSFGKAHISRGQKSMKN